MKSMTKALFNLPNILNHRVELQENYLPKPSPQPNFKYGRTTDRQRIQLIDWSSLGHKLVNADMEYENNYGWKQLLPGKINYLSADEIVRRAWEHCCLAGDRDRPGHGIWRRFDGHHRRESTAWCCDRVVLELCLVVEPQGKMRVANIANCTFLIRQLGYVSSENSLQSLKNTKTLYIIYLDVN